MKSNWKRVAGFTLILSVVCMSANINAIAGTRAGNGGTIVLDNGTWALADLHFQATGERYVFDNELSQELKDTQTAITQIFNIDLSSRYKELFDDIFSPLVEYKFVDKLPEGCSFIPPENLPQGLPRVDIGCTQGMFTYILPQYFSKLDVLQQALLIIHERLGALFPQAPYEIRTAIVNAIYILMDRYYPSYLKNDMSLRLTQQELDVLNDVYRRYAQLSGETEFDPNSGLRFLESGARMDSQSKVSGENLSLSPTTVLTQTTLSGKNSVVDGSVQRCDLEVNDSKVDQSSLGCDFWKHFVLSASKITGHSSLTLAGDLDHAQVDSSTFVTAAGSDIQVSHAVMVHILGSQIRVNQVQTERPLVIAGADIDVERVSPFVDNDEFYGVSGLFEDVKIIGNHIQITDSKIGEGFELNSDHAQIGNSSLSSWRYFGRNNGYNAGSGSPYDVGTNVLKITSSDLTVEGSTLIAVGEMNCNSLRLSNTQITSMRLNIAGVDTVFDSTVLRVEPVEGVSLGDGIHYRMQSGHATFNIWGSVTISKIADFGFSRDRIGDREETKDGDSVVTVSNPSSAALSLDGKNSKYGVGEGMIYRISTQADLDQLAIWVAH